MLSVVATPIGNLEDITLRALRVLAEAEYVLCEDTRVTGKLLAHFDISVPLKRYDAHASEKVHEEVLADLRAGKHICLVSDAGTPGVSDPGVLLVRGAHEAGVSVVAVPGASSVSAAFSIAGVAGNSFVFLGYAPQKKGRQTFFGEVLVSERPVMFFESTHRIMKALDALREAREVVVCREMTKLHEEVVRGTGAEVLAYFAENTEHQKGEFVLIVSP